MPTLKKISKKKKSKKKQQINFLKKFVNKKMKITHVVYSYLGGPLSLVNSFLNDKNSPFI